VLSLELKFSQAEVSVRKKDFVYDFLWHGPEPNGCLAYAK
jgi:hypothetical protein